MGLMREGEPAEEVQQSTPLKVLDRSPLFYSECHPNAHVTFRYDEKNKWWPFPKIFQTISFEWMFSEPNLKFMADEKALHLYVLEDSPKTENGLCSFFCQEEEIAFKVKFVAFPRLTPVFFGYTGSLGISSM